jgi:hypothetical protein
VTPDAMIDAHKARATAPKATDRDALAAIVTIASLDARGAYGHGQRALEEIGADAFEKHPQVGIRASVNHKASLYHG